MKDETMDNQQATGLEIGWLAGIYDGEGYLGFSRQNAKKVRSVRVDVQLVNCDPDVILKARRILNRIGINPYIRERVHNKKTWSRNYILTMSKFADVKKFIDTVGECLTGEKKKRAELMIRLINSRIGKTKRDRYTDEELGIIDHYFSKLKSIKIRGNTHTDHLNDYQASARFEILAKV
ncbi:MAG: LAGLIDADG family homing endonuclease [Candidatus Omnitrophica bacterium]|nr:LAGLIDADG family homing endonuclease [Candidatus Omnitrophota bacterium]